jgi:hypothetical protein
MFRIVLVASFAAALLACGPKPRPIPDAGEEEDAGMEEVDAGRQRGTDPANGWSNALELSPDAGALTRLGVSLASAPDQFNQPLLAGVVDDPNSDGVRDDVRVFFTRWDGVNARFEEPRTVEVVGAVDLSHPNRQVSVARDAVTGRIGVAYVKASNNTVRLAVSDDEGANFSLSTVSDEPRAALMASPALALHDGAAHLAWMQGSDVMYRKRTGAGAWVDQSPGSGVVLTGRTLALALDSAGNPGIAYFATVAGSSAELVFWRPGSSPVTVATADGLDLSAADREPSVSLTFDGTTPHLAYHLRKLAPLATADDTTELWYAKATDSGATWASPVAIPRTVDGTGTAWHSTQWYQAISLESTGRVSIAANWQAVGTPAACNGPKLARSTNGTSFDTCSPAATPVQRAGQWISMWSHKPGKQTILFHYEPRANPSIRAGVVMWREP